MNSDPSPLETDELIEMGTKSDLNVFSNAPLHLQTSIPSIFITHASGLKLQSYLHHPNITLPLFVVLNSTGEEILRTPTFLEMFVTFLQLSVVLWTSVGLLFFFSFVAGLFRRFKRRQAVHNMKSVQYDPANQELNYSEGPICLEEFTKGDSVKVLPCKHIFHENCAKDWIVDVRGVCPLCRRGIFEKEGDVDIGCVVERRVYQREM